MYRLRLSVCPACLRHERALSVAWSWATLVTLLGFLATALLVLDGDSTPLRTGAIAGAWLGALVLMGALETHRRSRRGPRCASEPTVQVAVQGRGYWIIFGNRTFGQRVAELNAPVVMSAR